MLFDGLQKIFKRSNNKKGANVARSLLAYVIFFFYDQHSNGYFHFKKIVNAYKEKNNIEVRKFPCDMSHTHRNWNGRLNGS